MVSSFPGLFAAAHVLLRLLAPRHPPCALRLLIMKNTVVAAMEFSRCARLPAEKPAEGPVSQNSTAWNVEVDVLLGELEHRTICLTVPDFSLARRAIHQQVEQPTGVMAPESLERR
jgi:hypothetical protein